MDPQLRDSLIKLAIPAAITTGLLLISRKRGVSLSEEYGFVSPSLPILGLWLAFWACWVGLGELAIGFFGLEQAKPWAEYPLHILILRILAIGVAGPIAEETVFRGVLFAKLQKTKVGVFGAVLLLSAGWAAAHSAYGVGTLVMIFVDSCVLFSARIQSKSIWVPIAMHVAGNLFSIWQSNAG